MLLSFGRVRNHTFDEQKILSRRMTSAKLQFENINIYVGNQHPESERSVVRNLTSHDSKER